QLQATLPGGSSSFSNPLLFNDIFWDNRAGTKGVNTVTGITPGDAYVWDLGVYGAPGSLAPTNSVIQQSGGYTASATNSAANPAVVDPSLEIPLTFTSWRTNVNFTGAIMVTAGMPPTLMGNYHLGACPGSPACNLGAASKNSINAPTFDIDNQARPASGGYDAGADELPPPPTDLSITKTDGVSSANAGGAVQYTIVVANAGPNPATGAAVADTVPTQLTGVTWTCGNATGGASCAAASGSGNVNTTVNLPSNSSVTFLVNGTLASTTSGSLANTATVTAPSTVNDTNSSNNSATDTDTIIPTTPSPTLLDNFNRTNANTLGANWSQVTINRNATCSGGGSIPCASIWVNSNQALANSAGQAIWNNPSAGYGAKQAAAFTFANTTLANNALMLKASGGTANLPANFIRVRYSGSAVVVETTGNAGLSYTTLATLAATFANGDRLIAQANADGSVDVWKTTAANVTTYVGHSAASSFTGTGRIGIQMPAGARVDDFSGGTLP
ncbi:MAG TPA: DUF11 domain-containing protein, partial [Roseiflexaceae bacterium]|nr:DUF11 domain-containing protein [Roseiflexaceae bacterium]